MIAMLSKWIPLSIAKQYILHSPLRKGKYFLFTTVEQDFTTQIMSGPTISGRTIDMVQGCIYYFGIWEPNITAFILSRLVGQEGRTFLDIGANIGYYSVIAAHFMPKGQIVAIEALPDIYGQLEANISINQFQNIRAVHCAVTDSQHTVNMYPGLPRFDCLASSRSGWFVTDTPIEVMGMPLATILTTAEIRSARLVKIDVEGAEFDVLKGMVTIWHLFPSDVEFIIEFTPELLQDDEQDGIFRLFEEQGYLPYRVDNPYYLDAYLHKNKGVELPKRLHVRPNEQTDIIFSRIDSEILPLGN